MKILITGVYGTVGSYLCNKLKHKHEIIGIGRKEKYDECRKYYSCDITNKNQLENIIKENGDLDIIIHCAALAHNKGNDLSKERFMKVNYEATKYFVDLSNEYLKLKNFIFISTISVYGERLEQDIYVETDICKPKSPYAVAKKLSEEYVSENFKSNYSILRLAPVYSKNFTLNIERRSRIKGIPYIVGNGKQRLSLCNIRNIYEAINYILNNVETEVNEIYNISDSNIYEFNDLIEFIRASKKIVLPKFGFKMLYSINSVTLKKQFIHENSIKLVSDNIYLSDKINSKVKMKYNMNDIVYMKKILMLGNHEIVIYNFRRELIERMINEGYEVYVALPYGDKVKYLKEMGCKFVDTPINRRNTNPLEDLKVFFKYIKILKTIKPDVVLTYTVKPNVYGGIACRIKNIPYICNVTGLGSGYLNGGIVQKVVQNLSKLAFRKANKVFFQNTADRDLLISKNVVKSNYDLLPGSGVNLETYNVIPYPAKDEAINFNFVARVMKDKGIDEYLSAAKIIKQKYPNITFNVIGMIDQSCYEDILNQYEEEGIIKYHGFQTNMIPFIEKCSCIINPSHTEGMSNVLLENAACGRPVIASNIPGCKEIIDEDKNGYIFNVKEIDSLVEKIEIFINTNYDKKVDLGLKGRAKVEKEFDRKIVVDKYISEIENII